MPNDFIAGPTDHAENLHGRGRLDKLRQAIIPVLGDGNLIVVLE